MKTNLEKWNNHPPGASNPEVCWLWPYSKSGSGYGVVLFKGRQTNAHRAFWIQKNGPIPRGLHVLHKCDNRACMRLSHLYLGTAKQNQVDRAMRFKYWKALTKEMVIEARIQYKQGVSMTSLARRFGVKPRTLHNAAARKSWAWLE